MRTGTRCTTLTKLPDALSGGSSEKLRAGAAREALDLALELAARDRRRSSIVDLLARLHLADLRLLEVGDHVRRRSAPARSTGWPMATSWPSCTASFEATPSAGALTGCSELELRQLELRLGA